MALSPNVEMGYGIPDYRLAVTNSTLSVSDIFENKLKVYPNPFHEGKLNIDLKGVQNERFIDLVVTDLKGASLVNQRIEISGASDKHEIDFPAVCNGIYLLKVSSATYNKTIKLIKY